MKRFKFIILLVLAASLIALPCSAKRTLFRGDQVGKGSLEIEHNLDVGGNQTVDGNSTVTGNQTISGTLTNSRTRSFPLPLGGAAVDGSNDIDDATAPNIATKDSVPAIVWDDSSETAAVQWTFRLPSDFSSGLVVYALISSDTATGVGISLDWAVTVNESGTGFGSNTAQTAVASTSSSLDASNEVLTLTSDATAEALYSAGSWVTLELFNASTVDSDLELKGVDVTYTATH